VVLQYEEPSLKKKDYEKEVALSFSGAQCKVHVDKKKHLCFARGKEKTTDGKKIDLNNNNLLLLKGGSVPFRKREKEQGLGKRRKSTSEK